MSANPNLSRPPKKTETLEIRLDHAAKDAFMARCRAEGRTASEALRGFIDGRGPRPAKRRHGLGWTVAAALGAGLAVLGRIRLLNWLPRRDACGKPCQTCRHRCEYQAIKPQGQIDYEECFQCMDCVVIYESDELCAPLMVEKRKGRVIPVRAVPTPLQTA